MTVLESCGRCRTVLVPGQRTCLRCRAETDQPTRDCPACHRPTGTDAAFCPACGHAMTGPAPVPPPPAEAAAAAPFVAPRTPGAGVYLTIGVVVAVLVTFLGGLFLVQQTMFGPEAAVRGYFDALADRDARTALSYLSGSRGGDDGGRRSLLTDAVLKGDGYRPPSDLEVLEVERSDGSSDSARARVSFRVGERSHRTSISLQRRDETTYGVFHEWRLSDALPTVNVVAAAGAPVEVNGVAIRADVPASEYGAGVTVFPGRYTVGLADNLLMEAEPITLNVGTSGEKAALAVQLKDSARDETEKLVKEYLDDCAESTELEPPGCPFSAYSYTTVTDVEWTIEEYPTIQVELGPEGYVTVRTEMYGTASVTAKDDGGDTYEGESTFNVYGTVSAAGGKLTFHPPN